MIELLESRIAPAATVTFFEADGDKITVKTNKGTNADLLQTLTDQNGLAITKGETGITNFLIHFVKTAASAGAFAGTNLSITASGGHGDTRNQVNFVSIDAFEGSGGRTDLGNVTIKGHLVFIDAGDDDLETKAIKNLRVTSWGLGEGSISATSSEIHGNIGSIKVKKDFDGYIVSENATGVANFKFIDATVIGSFVVGHDIGLAEVDNGGHIQVNRIAKLVVKEDFFGSETATNCGLIEAFSLGQINIHSMDVDAKIILSSGP